MKTSNVMKLMVLVSCISVFGPRIQAQELDDVEADMDMAISESDAAQSAEEYGRKREAEEKKKLGVAKKTAVQTSVKAANVKDVSQKRLATLEQQTAQHVTERKQFEAQTQKANAQIKLYQDKVADAEAKLAAAKEDRRTSEAALKAAQDTIEAQRKHLAMAQANRKKEIAARASVNRQLASVARDLPGKSVVMAKSCPIHVAMDLGSTQTRYLKKGQKVELAKVGNDGWFHARTAGTKGFMHKTCK